MPDEPDLTAELDAAEDIVTGRVDKIETEWGVRQGEHVRTYGTDEHRARMEQKFISRRSTLVRRAVTYGPWEEASGD